MPSLKTIIHSRFKHFQINILQAFELNAVAGDGGFAKGKAEGGGEIGLIRYAHDVDGDAGAVGAEADLEL